MYAKKNYINISFFQQCVRTTNENVIFSPLSIVNVLALLLLAANGDTFKQMRKSLYLEDNKILIADHFHKYNELIKNNNAKTSLLIANQIYVKEGYSLKKTFQNIATEKFSCSVESLNFFNNIQAAQTINQFVDDKTNGKITNFIQAQDIDNDIALMLINAVYFKSDWKHKFNKSLTQPDNFYINENETVQVDFMKILSNFHIGRIDELEASALEMKYANSKYSFMILLPWSRTGLSTLETKLKKFDLTMITKSYTEYAVDVKIPKFKTEHDLKLNDILKNVCIKTVLNFCLKTKSKFETSSSSASWVCLTCSIQKVPLLTECWKTTSKFTYLMSLTKQSSTLTRMVQKRQLHVNINRIFLFWLFKKLIYFCYSSSYCTSFR